MLRVILACAMILFTLLSYAAPTFVQGIQTQSSVNETRITFVLSEKTKGKVTYLPPQKLVVIEFPAAIKKFEMNRMLLRQTVVESIIAKIYERKLQFYFALRDQVKWKINYIPSDDLSHQNLVLTITALHPVTEKKISRNDIDEVLASLATKNKVTGLARMQVPINFTPKKAPVFTVVIDAGHGGHDSGAVSQDGLQEKQVVMGIAKKLAQEINTQPNMRAVLTRQGDYFVPLRQRLKLARKGDADLFIAIHADAHFDKSAHGASVYALSPHGATTEAARWLVQKENYAELGDVELNALQDRSPILRSVLIDLAQTATIEDSLKLGNRILDKLDDITRLHYKKVEQAPFVVLKSPDIPSVLVETGFISHPVESKKLASTNYQSQLAHAIFLGIKKYAEK